MAPLSIPPELKKIKPFVQRAEELDRDKSPESRVVAYYCRQFAVQTGIPLAGTSPAAKKCLGELLAQLEGEKQAMSVFNRAESKQICRGFADKIFDKANAEDRAGVADKGTARTFYAAGSFFEILQQFDDDETTDEDSKKEEDEKRVYAKWKATEILKAIREGRKPTPGAFGESVEGEAEGGQDDAADSTKDSPGPSPPPYEAPPPASADSPPPPPVEPAAPDVFVPAPPIVPEPEEGDEEGTEVGLEGPPPAYPGTDDDDDVDGNVFVPGAVRAAAAGAVDRPPLTPAYDPPPPPVVPKPSPPPVPKPAPAPAPKSTFSSRWGLGKKGNSHVSKKALQDATELTQFALAALESKNADLAAERLQQALSALGR